MSKSSNPANSLNMQGHSQLALLTDLYELTMMQGYFFCHRHRQAVYEMFFRRQPFEGGYTIFAGLDPLLDVLENLRFTESDLDYLRSLKLFKQDFLDYLRDFRFNGDIFAVSEGTPVFPNEPIVRVHANIMEAQLVESITLNFINFQSLIATKTARIVHAANGSMVMEFGLRRAQGIDGAISGSRAAYIGGASSTSNVLAGKLYGIPVSGTMAHSWIMSFDTELESFEAYADLYPQECTLLVDTFDTLKSGIPNAIKVFKSMERREKRKLGIRLDSGDLEYLSKAARKMLDENGLPEVKIVASNELDERIANQLRKTGAPIDGWGIGTKLITANDDPALTGVYKIAARLEKGKESPTIKISNNPEKTTNPGIKNVYRFYDQQQKMVADLIYLEKEEEKMAQSIQEKAAITFNHPNIDYARFSLDTYGEVRKLLQPVMKAGKKLAASASLDRLQQRTRRELASLDSTYKRLINPHIYKVSLSDRLKQLKRDMIRQHRGNQQPIL